MNKVMTRTKRRPGTRPPGRHDTRRPGTTPPRAPGAGAPRPAPGDTPPPTPPAEAASRTLLLPSPGDHARPSPPPSSPPPQPRPTDLFADRLLAVLSGQRPVHCMLRHTAGRAYDELAWLAERGPLRTHGTRPVVRDIGYYVPRPGAIEAFARIGAGDRLRAMAFRLERGPDLRWRCTAVELGGPRMPRRDDD
ncbi:Rv3235 family protein [Streptomyces sp. NBC_01340]|uniref:Rv3235 family protein n=1 Tax=unclassified Streptomyces TaxID=2593676 RepID=UPI00224FF4AB|nr:MULTISPECIES: Rv3235 family protein [unclassified Streptomyces]MCX4454506.1 Rv3235 family protein [Streptomyces sp. NBC_01719]MCX4493866.1 Rv3235 family protein [Streptomyces sp. NBC_01728]MCX4591582.1 Rv3235 family protein [Streptomyces sp. NBC_01549]WSI38959.1 Rv3235 family protein [Streptomyces sp. NBC_01340]